MAKSAKQNNLKKARFTGSVSVLIPAHNEETSIARRINEFVKTFETSGINGEIIVISDGSTDHTAQIVRATVASNVKIIELVENIGKAQALMRGRNEATGDIIVLADSRQRWAPDALMNLLENFADASVGGACGDLIIESAPGVLSGVGLYWIYEKWIRRNESLVHSTVGVTGAISAVRRELFPNIPAGTILDDVYWPMKVVLQGHRVLHDEHALAYDQLPDKASDEFRRKVRTLTGNFQLMALLPSILMPWHNPIWIQFVSHKVMRLLVPWMLLVILALSIILSHPIYKFVLLAQLAFYLFGLVGITRTEQSSRRIFSVIGSFLLLNIAAFVAFWAWLFGATTWHKVTYQKVEDET